MTISRQCFSTLRTVLVAGIIALGEGCSPEPPQINIEGQYANLSPMFIGVGSVFMKIRNAGGGDALVGATVNIPKATVELHDVRNGRMEKVEKMPVPSRGAVELKPKSLHIMIFNMPKNVQEGTEIALSLRFEKSGEKRVPVTFVKPADMQMHGHH